MKASSIVGLAVVLLAFGCASHVEQARDADFDADLAEWDRILGARLEERGIPLRSYLLLEFKIEEACRDAEPAHLGLPESAGYVIDCFKEAGLAAAQAIGLDEDFWAMHDRRDAERAPEYERIAEEQRRGRRQALGFLLSVAETTLGAMQSDMPVSGAVSDIARAAVNTPEAGALDAFRTLIESSGGPAPAIAAVGGVCEIPGYPAPSAPADRLGLSWCPASVTLQLRSFALVAAGAWCAINGGTSSTPEQVAARKREVRENCDRLDALNGRLAGGRGDCVCPSGYREGGP